MIIAPSLDQVDQWVNILEHRSDLEVFTAIAQWGADQELEACCEYLAMTAPDSLSRTLRKYRCPKPPRLKEQALTALYAVATGANDTREQHQDLDTIRQALEALDD